MKGPIIRYGWWDVTVTIRWALPRECRRGTCLVSVTRKVWLPYGTDDQQTAEVASTPWSYHEVLSSLLGHPLWSAPLGFPPSLIAYSYALYGVTLMGVMLGWCPLQSKCLGSFTASPVGPASKYAWMWSPPSWCLSSPIAMQSDWGSFSSRKAPRPSLSKSSFIWEYVSSTLCDRTRNLPLLVVSMYIWGIHRRWGAVAHKRSALGGVFFCPAGTR